MRTAMILRTALLRIALALTACCASAHAQTFGNYVVFQDDKGIDAVTINQSGDAFGEFCLFTTKTCAWHIALSSSCETGNVYNAIAGTDQRAGVFELRCRGPAAKWFIYEMMHWKDLGDLLVNGVNSGGDSIGIAISPQQQQGQLLPVHRFVLNGLKAASRHAETLFYRPQKGS